MANLYSLNNPEFDSVDAAYLYNKIVGKDESLKINLYPGNHRVAYRGWAKKVFDYTAYPRVMSTKSWVKYMREKFRKVKR